MTLVKPSLPLIFRYLIRLRWIGIAVFIPITFTTSESILISLVVNIIPLLTTFFCFIYVVSSKFTKLHLIFYLIICFSFIQMFFNNGDYYFAIKHLYYDLLFFSSLFFGYKILNNTESIMLFVNELNKNLKYEILFFVIYFILYSLGYINYYGFQVNMFIYILIILCFGKNKNKYLKALLLLLIAILSGKRAAMILAVIPFLLCIYYLESIKRKTFLLFLGGLFLVLTINYNERIIQSLILISKIDYPTLFQLDNFNLALLTSGRSLEIQSVIIKIIESPLNLFYGFGYGTSYFSEGIGLAFFERTSPYLHFTPLYFILVHGLIGLYFTFVIPINRLLRIKKFIFSNKISFFLFSIVICILAMSAFANVYIADPLAGLIIGALISVSSKQSNFFKIK